MLKLDPIAIANVLIPALVGGWIFWVSRNIIKNGKDITACFTKLRTNQDKEQENGK